MRLTALILFFFFLPFSSIAQIGGEDEVYLNGDSIEAKFQGGGIDNFSEFIHKEFDYSKVTKPGKMVGAFTIDVDGNVKNIKIIEFFDVESATEFIRVLKKCPKWEPAKRGGKPISIEIKYPMIFRQKQQPKQETIKSENGNATTPTNDENVIDSKSIELDPEYPGGITNFRKYIAKNFRVPEVEGLKGKIIVSFIVEKDGSLSQIKVLNDIGYGTADEIKRVLKECPKWKPGTQRGIPVRCLKTLPITISATH